MNPENAIELAKELEPATYDIVSVAQGIVISTEQENTKAATLMSGWKQEKKRRVEIFAPSKKATKNAYDEVRKLESAAIDPIDEAIKTVDGKCGAFVQSENARRAELQRVEDRKAAELQAKEDARQAELQRKADEAYATKCAKAAALNKPAPVAPAYVPPPIIVQPRVVAAVSAPTGTTYQEYWSATVTDLKALCAAVAAGTADPSFVQGVESALNGWAKLKKIEGPILPGVIGVKRIGTKQRAF